MRGSCPIADVGGERTGWSKVGELLAGAWPWLVNWFKLKYNYCEGKVACSRFLGFFTWRLVHEFIVDVDSKERPFLGNEDTRIEVT